MRMVDIITSKRNGNELTDEEISFFVRGYTKGEIPDYQVSALMMAIYFRGMNERETLTLTTEMENSGDKLDLSAIRGIKVDKHSTGGVGDKTSLALTPIVSACGVPIAKMSGRGLGHTGGTIDKLESFDGFNVSIPTEQFIDNEDSMRKLKILQNIDRRIALDDIANALGIDFEELLDELEGIVLYSGNKVNIDYFLEEIMDRDDVSDIYEYFRESDSGDLKEAYKELGADYEEDEIRLVRIKFISEMAN